MYIKCPTFYTDNIVIAQEEKDKRIAEGLDPEFHEFIAKLGAMYPKLVFNVDKYSIHVKTKGGYKIGYVGLSLGGERGARVEYFMSSPSARHSMYRGKTPKTSKMKVALKLFALHYKPPSGRKILDVAHSYLHKAREFGTRTVDAFEGKIGKSMAKIIVPLMERLDEMCVEAGVPTASMLSLVKEYEEYLIVKEVVGAPQTQVGYLLCPGGDHGGYFVRHAGDDTHYQKFTDTPAVVQHYCNMLKLLDDNTYLQGVGYRCGEVFYIVKQEIS